MAVSIVQHANINGSGNGAAPGSLVLGGAPTAGNLILAFLSMQPSTSTTIDTTKWTILQQADVTTHYVWCLSRYAVGGDTATLPAFSTAGAGYWAAIAYELSGVSGTIGTAVPTKEGGLSSANPFAITTMTTGFANQLAIVAASQYNGAGSGIPDFGSGWTNDEQNSNFANYGVWGSGHQFFVSSGSSVNSSVALSSSPNGYVAVLVSPGSSGETGTGVLSFGGIALVGAGHKTSAGVAAMHFGALALVINGSDITAPTPPTPPTPPATSRPRVDPLAWNVPITNKDGSPMPEFQRKWDKQASVNAGVVPQTYIDGQDAAQLASSQQYTQDYSATTLVAAKTYADMGDATTLSTSEAYTDAAVAGLGTGSVTSVALTAPAIFSVAGSPITAAGTLAISLLTQAANKVWAGPTMGSAAAPTFRSLVAADIPDLSAVYDAAGLAAAAVVTAEAYTDSRVALYLPLTGGTMSGAIALPNKSASTPSLAFNTNHGFFYDTTHTGIGVSVGGTQLGWFAAGGPTYQRTGGSILGMTVQGEAATTLTLLRYSSDTNSANTIQGKARGTIASPVVPVTSDLLGASNFQAWTGAAFTTGGQFRCTLTETAIVDPTHVGSRFTFFLCPIGSGTLADVAHLENESGLSLFNNPVIDQNRVFRPRAYTVATVPAVTATGLIYVTDEGGGKCLAYSDGTSWRRTADGQVLTASTATGRGFESLVTSRMSYVNQDIVQRVYGKLSAAGLLTKLLGLWVHAGAPSSQADALRNWITFGVRDLVIVGSPTWSQLGGFTGDGATALLNTGASIATFGASQNSFTVGCYVLAASAAAAAVIGQSVAAATRGNYMQSFTSGALTTRCMDGTNDSFTPARYTGLFTMSRILSTGYNDSLDDLAATAVTRTSAAFTARTIAFLGTNDTTANEYSTASIAFSFIGNGLTATDIANLRAIMVDYYLVQTGVISATYAVARLPGATAAFEGQRIMVSDSSVAASGNFGATVAGGGSNHVPCTYESGTPAWRIG